MPPTLTHGYDVWSMDGLRTFHLYVRNPVASSILRYWSDMYEIHKTKANSAKRLMHVWNEARWRSASHEIDRPFVMAVLLGFKQGDMDTIVACKDKERRIFLLYKLMQSVPANIIFIGGPRLESDDEHRLSWAPARFSHFDRLNILTDGVGVPGPDGLEVAFPGLILRVLQRNVVLTESNEFYIFNLETDQTLIVRLVGRWKSKDDDADTGI